MRIAIINKTAGGMSGGYKKYLYNIIPRLAENSNVESVLCATPKSVNIQELFNVLPNVKFIDCQPFQFLRDKSEPELENYLEKFSPDVIFIPLERYYKFNDIPIVNILRNMEPFAENIDENSLTDKFRLYIQRLVAKRAIKKSDRTIAVSKYVKEFLLNKWNVPEEKIGLVYHGIESLLIRECVRPKNIPKDWEENFLFTAGSIRPARGLEDIIEAMKYLTLEKANIKGLVIAGETELRMIPYRRKLEEWIKMNNLSSKICWTGKLSEKEMSWCYKNCKVFVMTSRVESFGMIAGEAMAHGCVCISSDSPCLPEIFGDAAVFYPSKRGEVLAEAIQIVFRWDSYKCKEMSERAKRQAAKFSWDITKEKLLAELKKVTKN